MPGFYILDEEHHLVPATVLEWARYFEDFQRRRVAETETELFVVSTVFLGLDHRHFGEGPPIVFETMVFEREREIIEIWGRLISVRPDVEGWRYASWDDAVAGHDATVSRLRRQEADVKALLAASSRQQVAPGDDA